MQKIYEGYIPGCIGRVAELHGIYYAKHWGFGAFFEAKVAEDLAQFINQYDASRDGLWTVCVSDRIEGAIAIDGTQSSSVGAHLRWFILSDILRGQGMGNQLVRTAIKFCQRKGYHRVYLWTFEGLHAARYLYEKMGFQLVEQHQGKQWGTEVNEQKFELQLGYYSA